MLAKAKQTFHKTLITFVLTLCLVLSVFQCLPGRFLPNPETAFASSSFSLENSAVASIPADPEPFPYHPHY